MKVEEVHGGKYCLKLVKYDLAFYLAFLFSHDSELVDVQQLCELLSLSFSSTSSSYFTLLVYKQFTL